jgi:hypothetical protein
VLEELTEEQLLEIDRHQQIANASVTRYETVDGELRLRHFNSTDHLAEQDEDVTEEPDVAQQS